MRLVPGGRPVTPGAVAAITGAGLAAGTINTVVGSGSLITFPTLISLFGPGVALTANVSNTIGLIPGSLSGAWGYRRELSGQRALLRLLLPICAAGGLTGAALLLVLPRSVFRAVVPVLIVAALILVIAQPRLARRLAARRGACAEGAATPRPGPGLAIPLALASVYGGYFGAAQGVIYLALLGASVLPDLQRANGVKNVLAAVVNGVAAIVFVALARPNWAWVGLIAVGATVGGQLGAYVGRRLPPAWLRAVIVVVGLVALVRLR